MRRMAFVFGLTTTTTLAAVVASAQTPTVSVDRLAESVYLFTYNAHRSLFVATDAGVLATDPQSPEAARRYLAEIRKITAAPVRYLVYSHHHGDHASGGAELGTGVTKIAHDSMRRHLPATGGAIAPPDVTFADTATVHLGDLEIRLLYPGPSETESNIIVHVPARGVAFIVDSVFVRAVPWRDMAGANPDQWIAALRKLEQVDFTILALGHGPVGTKADVTAFIEYLTVLRDTVARRMKQGQTLEQIQATLTLPQYAGWGRYDDHFTLNIAGIYRELAKR